MHAISAHNMQQLWAQPAQGCKHPVRQQTRQPPARSPHHARDRGAVLHLPGAGRYSVACSFSQIAVLQPWHPLPKDAEGDAQLLDPVRHVQRVMYKSMGKDTTRNAALLFQVRVGSHARTPRDTDAARHLTQLPRRLCLPCLPACLLAHTR